VFSLKKKYCNKKILKSSIGLRIDNLIHRKTKKMFILGNLMLNKNLKILKKLKIEEVRARKLIKNKLKWAFG